MADVRDPALESAILQALEAARPYATAIARAERLEADDLLNAAWILADKKAATIPPDQLTPWLHGVIRRLASEARRAESRHTRHVKDAAASGRFPSTSPHGLPPDDLQTKDVAALVEASFANLSPAEVAVIKGTIAGNSQADLAQASGIPRGTLGVAATRATQKIKRTLDRAFRRGAFTFPALWPFSRKKNARRNTSFAFAAAVGVITAALLLAPKADPASPAPSAPQPSTTPSTAPSSPTIAAPQPATNPAANTPPATVATPAPQPADPTTATATETASITQPVTITPTLAVPSPDTPISEIRLRPPPPGAKERTVANPYIEGLLLKRWFELNGIACGPASHWRLDGTLQQVVEYDNHKHNGWRLNYAKDGVTLIGHAYMVDGKSSWSKGRFE